MTLHILPKEIIDKSVGRRGRLPCTIQVNGTVGRRGRLPCT